MFCFKKKKKSHNPIHLWDEDNAFNNIYNQISTRTLVDIKRCFMIYQYAKSVSTLDGDVAEIGVYKGGTARLISEVFEASGKTLHLFDTFSGMPDINPEKDLHKKGDFDNTSLEKVKAFLSRRDNIRIYKGLFPETAAPVKDKAFCFVHVDVDIYKSVLDCCEFFYPRLVKCGMLVFDDYGFISCPGAKMAVDQFFKDKPESPCYLPTGQCIVVRL